MTDTEFMKTALELARKGCGWVAPNPKRKRTVEDRRWYISKKFRKIE